MGNRVALQHTTSYQYERAVAFGPQKIQLCPAPGGRTPILSYALEVRPADRLLHWQFDPLGNRLARVILPSKTAEFVVEVRLEADLTPYNPFDFFVEPAYAQFPFVYDGEAAELLGLYLATEPAGPLLAEFVAGLSRETTDTVSFLLASNRAVRDRVGYTTRLEHGVQRCEETLALGTGSCRDSSWLLVQVFRRLGIAARFVSGYLIQVANDAPDGPKVDSADLHAWVEVYLPGAGWIGLDPTSGLLTAEGHIPLVCTPSASQAAPIGGTVEPAEVRMEHTMAVTR